MTAKVELMGALLQLKKETMLPVLIAGTWIFGWPIVCVAIGFVLII